MSILDDPMGRGSVLVDCPVPSEMNGVCLRASARQALQTLPVRPRLAARDLADQVGERGQVLTIGGVRTTQQARAIRAGLRAANHP
jgi:hypothetical protein